MPIKIRFTSVLGYAANIAAAISFEFSWLKMNMPETNLDGTDIESVASNTLCNSWTHLSVPKSTNSD
jgi:hypothetical protein